MKSAPSNNAKFYDAFAHTYTDLYQVLDAAETVRQWLGLLTELAPGITPNRLRKPRLMDVACGPGWHLAHWVAANYVTAGFDSSSQMLAIARQTLNRAGARGVPLYQANLLDAEAFPPDIGVYDLLVSHTNFPQLFSPLHLQLVATSLTSISRPGSYWMFDVTSPALAPNRRMQEHFTDTRGTEWVATGSHRAAGKQYCIKWQSNGQAIGVEYYWMHFGSQIDTILRSSGWTRRAWRSWHPHDRLRPWRRASTASKRLVCLYEFHTKRGDG